MTIHSLYHVRLPQASYWAVRVLLTNATFSFKDSSLLRLSNLCWLLNKSPLSDQWCWTRALMTHYFHWKPLRNYKQTASTLVSGEHWSQRVLTLFKIPLLSYGDTSEEVSSTLYLLLSSICLNGGSQRKHTDVLQVDNTCKYTLSSPNHQRQKRSLKRT